VCPRRASQTAEHPLMTTAEPLVDALGVTTEIEVDEDGPTEDGLCIVDKKLELEIEDAKELEDEVET
jgi:hypothetical protein